MRSRKEGGQRRGRGENQRIYLVDTSFVVDELKVRPRAPGLMIGEMTAKKFERLALPIERRLTDPCPARCLHTHQPRDATYAGNPALRKTEAQIRQHCVCARSGAISRSSLTPVFTPTAGPRNSGRQSLSAWPRAA